MAFNTFHNLPEDKQNRVMDVAASEFADHGFHQASVNRMVQSLGIAKGSLFKYFGTKEGLFEALFERSLRQVKDSLKDAGSHDALFDERFRSIMLAALAFIDAHPRLYRIYLKLLVQENAPLRDKLLATVRTSTATFLRPLVERGMERGELREDLDMETTVFLLEAALERFLQGARVPGMSPDLFGVSGAEAERRARRMVTTLTTGLGPKP